MRINYFLKDSKKNKSAINAIFYYNGRHKMAVGISVEVKYWNGNRAIKPIEYEQAEIINLQLEEFESQIKAICATFTRKQHKPTTTEIKAEYKARNTATQQNSKAHEGTFTKFISDYKNRYIEISTRNKYQTAANLLLQYEKQHYTKLSYDDINLQFYENFRNWFFTLTYKPAKKAKPQYYSKNYYGSIIKCIKKALKESGPESINPQHNNTSYKNQLFKVEHEPADTIYLSIDELQQIHTFTATPENVKPLTADTRPHNLQRLSNALNLTKNKFLIGCFTALRVSDFNRLGEINLDNNFIRITPRKGTAKNEPVVIPIHPIIKEILNSGFNIAAPVSDQKLNTHIKQVCKLVGITKAVTVIRTEAGRQTERIFKKYELVCTHTARRSGATNMYLAGVPAISIMKITGHKTERSFMRYIKITQEENALLLAQHAFFK